LPDGEPDYPVIIPSQKAGAKVRKKVKREKKKGKKIALAALESNFSDLTFCHQ
jgi:hypothetical protein